jgi:hypothetical protein
MGCSGDFNIACADPPLKMHVDGRRGFAMNCRMMARASRHFSGWRTAATLTAPDGRGSIKVQTGIWVTLLFMRP